MNNLRHILIPLIIALLAVAGSCTQRSLPELDRAEALIDSLPDSSLAITASIDTARLTSQALRARHALLLSLARHKCHLCDSSTDTISIAADYYGSHGSKREKMLAMYLLGVTQYRNKSFADAISALLKAETLAEEINDNKYLGLTRQYISSTYGMAYIMPEQLVYAHRAMDAFREYGDIVHLAFAHANIASAMLGLNMTTESVAHADSALHIADSLNITGLIADTECIIARNNISQKNYKEALRHYNKAESIASGKIRFTDKVDIGQAMDSAGTTISPADISHIANLKYDDTDLYVATPDYYARKGDYKRAYDVAKQQNDSAWKRLKVATCQTITGTVNHLKKGEIQNKEARLRTLRSYAKLSMTILIIAASLFAIYLRHRRKANRIKEAAMQEQIAAIMSDIADAQHQISVATRKTRSAIIKSYTHANAMLETDYEISNAELKKKRMLALMEAITDKVKNIDRLPELEKSINKFNNDCIKILRSEVPSATDEEIRLYMLMRIGLSPQAISVAMGTTVKSVYNRKHKLKNKIRLSEAPHIDMLMEAFNRGRIARS